MAKRKYYAEISPRGFGNELDFYEFPNKQARDHFVEERFKAEEVPASEVRRIWKLGDRDNGYYNNIYPVFINRKGKRECEESGGTWVDEYIRTDGKRVRGYCRYVDDKDLLDIPNYKSEWIKEHQRWVEDNIEDEYGRWRR